VNLGPQQVRVVRKTNDEWPARLSELGSLAPAERLFVAGRPLPQDTPTIAVVGTRRPTGAGLEAATTLSAGLAEAGFVVVSGLAVGVDAAAHNGALEAGGHTIAVLGCGLDVDYPAANARLKRAIHGNGTLVSEYPLGTAPARWRFPERNRIITGLSLGVVVVEGGQTSGALVTARLALDANRTVYAVPGSVRNPMARGPNELIRTARAALVLGVEHIFEDLVPHLVWNRPPTPQRAPAVRLDPDDDAVLGALDDVPLAPDRLCSAAGLAPGRLAVALARLEVRGLAARSGGGWLVTSAGGRARADKYQSARAVTHWPG
jgi:DNA processing protein